MNSDSVGVRQLLLPSGDWKISNVNVEEREGALGEKLTGNLAKTNEFGGKIIAFDIDPVLQLRPNFLQVFINFAMGRIGTETIPIDEEEDCDRLASA